MLNYIKYTYTLIVSFYLSTKSLEALGTSTMHNTAQISSCYFLSYCKYLKNFVALVALACSFSVNASLIYTSPADKLYENDTGHLTKNSWLDRVTGAFGSFFNSTNLAKGSEYGRNKNNSIRYLQHMFDENDLYNRLEVFKDKPVFEVLATVYVNIVLRLYQIDHNMTEMELEVPDWIVKFRPITKKIGARNWHLLPANKVARFDNLKAKDKFIAEYELAVRAKQYLSVLQTLFPHQVNTNKPDPFIQSELNKSVTILMSVIGKNAENCTGMILDKPRELLNELLAIYVVSSVSNPASVVKFPVIEALVRWGASNPKSLVSELLYSSKCYAEQKHHLAVKENKTYKISKEDQVFFSYLQCSSKYAWHDASQSLRNMETSNISNALLGNDVVEKVVKKFETVKQLAAACEDGFAGLDVMHHGREQQEILRIGCMNESPQQGKVKNIKDSFLGKIASGICYAFNAVKSNLITTPSKQEQGKKIVADLVKLVEKNALQLKLGAVDEGIRLVMDELIRIDSLHKEGDITITNALTTLVEQHFTSAKTEKAFSLLTGLKRETNKQRNTYYYKTLTPDNDLVNKETNDGDKDHQKDWLDMANTDYVLQKDDLEQEVCNAGASSQNIKRQDLHQDWDFIKVESKEENEESYEEQSRGNIIFSFGCSKGTAASIRKMIFMALPFFIIANAIPGSYGSSIPRQDINQSASQMINITNATELTNIGLIPQYPTNGSYQFMNSFDASSFNTIHYLTGHINGNNILFLT
ncbi:MAG: hypothetical protein QS748_00250 [Candidatus Endonucleobacter bathymodioli]|uniref:Uncharacterized protein n=1 Tax=Candidatus Endonucleibacter bathymodioli TaxID=539814 RepID=A0AA90SWH7_9GAMM|nr:hypothetical protein [Candidatus Endonucleobacter bathymodioli]